MKTFNHITNLNDALNRAGIQTRIEQFNPTWAPEVKRRRPKTVICITLLGFNGDEPTEILFDANTGKVIY